MPGKTPVGVMDRKTEWRPRDAKASQKCRRPTVRPSVRPSVHHRIFDQKWKLEKLYESKGIESKLRSYRPVGGKSHLAHLFVFFGRPWQAMTGHDRPWPAMDGHDWPWTAMPGHDRPWPAIAGHGRPWQAMAGHARPRLPTLYVRSL